MIWTWQGDDDPLNDKVCALFGAFAEILAEGIERWFKGEQPKRTCNRHDDCEKANAEARAKGAYAAAHCHDECCEECFGS